MYLISFLDLNFSGIICDSKIRFLSTFNFGHILFWFLAECSLTKFLSSCWNKSYVLPLEGWESILGGLHDDNNVSKVSDGIVLIGGLYTSCKIWFVFCALGLFWLSVCFVYFLLLSCCNCFVAFILSPWVIINLLVESCINSHLLFFSCPGTL